MENKIISKVQEAMDTLDVLADSYGIARASKIAVLANHLIEISRNVSAMQEELAELRKFKEEHSDDKRNEVSAES